MKQHEKKKVLAVVEDLFFTVKINDAAKRAGLAVDFVKNDEDAIAKAASGPLLIILDLNNSSATPLELISRLKSTPEYKGISVIGYVSHVHGDLKQKAHEAGCDMVMARSAFSQNLPLILKRHANAA
jgi:CheY-like chemotaxis protein